MLVDTPIVVAIIAGAASLFASALTFFLTKKKERDADWRRVRIEQYRELISAMSEVAGSNPTEAARRRLALASNHVGLFASPPVLRCLTALLDAVKVEHAKVLAKALECHPAVLLFPEREDHRQTAT